jgi:hypothetical protein
MCLETRGTDIELALSIYEFLFDWEEDDAAILAKSDIVEFYLNCP